MVGRVGVEVRVRLVDGVVAGIGVGVGVKVGSGSE